MRNTKIVATLGPATDSPESLHGLFEAGVNVFRLNASHSNWDQHTARMAAVRKAAIEFGVQVAILLDLQGPKIRLGEFEGGGCELQTGAFFTISSKPTMGSATEAYCTYQPLPSEVRPGDRVLLNDGAVELEAISSDATSVRFTVISGGPVGNHKGVNLPGVKLSTPALTEKDAEDLDRGLDADVDFVALSFVRNANDVYQLRRRLEERESRAMLIAKIEKPEGWENIESVLDASDGVMVARGDLGVELPLERVPFIQKRMIELARQKGKFVITATQMLESMIDNARPTRAEVSDVANAICDGTDAVMLSAETSVGHNPAAAVHTMGTIAVETEGWLRPKGFPDPLPRVTPSNAEIVAEAAYHAARSASVAAIIVFTTSGVTARLISRYRPPVPIYAFTQNSDVARQLTVSFGVHPILAPEVLTTERMLLQMEQALLERGLLHPGDNVVFVAGQPIGHIASTNLMKLHRLERVEPRA
ncbi:MAG: pyruvate kinase [Bryobacteraceae bacterium]